MTQPAHGTTEPRGIDAVRSSSTTEGRFGRMFRNLPIVEFEDAELKDLAKEMVDKAGTTGRDNPDIPSGYTYFGQFVDHDITLDKTPVFEQENDPDAVVNFRTPRLDLDCLFGLGPKGSPELYDKKSVAGAKLLVGRNPETDDDGTRLDRDDLPRGPQSTALIGDPRNDENIIVSQLHLTFIRFYNKLVDLEAQKTDDPSQILKHARRRTRWHYQWVVIHDFLKRIAGDALVDKLLAKDEHGDPSAHLKFYKPKNTSFMPVEFSVAAYRFGHSMVRPTYSLNETVQDVPIFLSKGKAGPLDDLRGFRRLPGFWTIDWSFFLKLSQRKPQPTRKIDTLLAEGLSKLAGETGDARLLPFRNLMRGKALGLPPGRQVALAVGEKELTPREMGRNHPVPLWFYVLKEAEVRERGRRLGPVGARIVAETLIGLLANDPLSYLRVQPRWRPTLKSDTEGEFTLADLVRFATS
jgi:hypothetical protein